MWILTFREDPFRSRPPGHVKQGFTMCGSGPSVVCGWLGRGPQSSDLKDLEPPLNVDIVFIFIDCKIFVNCSSFQSGLQ